MNATDHQIPQQLERLLHRDRESGSDRQSGSNNRDSGTEFWLARDLQQVFGYNALGQLRPA